MTFPNRGGIRFGIIKNNVARCTLPLRLITQHTHTITIFTLNLNNLILMILSSYPHISHKFLTISILINCTVVPFAACLLAFARWQFRGSASFVVGVRYSVCVPYPAVPCPVGISGAKTAPLVGAFFITEDATWVSHNPREGRVNHE